MSSPALRLEGLTVEFGSSKALDGVDLTVEDGEVVAVVGPSGSGKSTLLRAIAGLQPIARGRIAAVGRDLAGIPTHQRRLGLMFQDHALFTNETVARNIGFGLRMAGSSSEAVQARVGELLTLVGLEGFGDRSVDTLSGGEAQRVALARSLAPEPAILMLDEPLGSLDRSLRRQLTSDLRALLAAEGVSALHVTHDQAEAFAIADRVVVLRAGRVEQVGPAEDLWRRPSSRFVAEFLGHPNLWVVDGTTTLVPITALTVDPAGSVEVVVVDVAFADGVFRVNAIAVDSPGQVVVFDTIDRPTVSRTLRLAVDDAQVITLDH